MSGSARATRLAAHRGNPPSGSCDLTPHLPVLSGRRVVRIFEKFGWEIARQRGNHIILVKEGSIATLSVPDHKEVARGTLRSLIRDAGLTVDEFVAQI